MTKRNAKAVEVSGYDECTFPGAFYFYVRSSAPDERAGIIYSCPCGCGGLLSMRFRGHNPGGPEWDVSGEWPNASATPSIGIRATPGTKTAAPGPDGFHWHGYLRNGVFEEC